MKDHKVVVQEVVYAGTFVSALENLYAMIIRDHQALVFALDAPANYEL